MATRKAALAALRIILSERRNGDDLWTIIQDFRSRSHKGSLQGAFLIGLPNGTLETHNHFDRAIAVVLTSILEQGLETAIKTHFVDLADDPDHNQLFAGDGTGPLTSASAKIRLGYALGVYGKKTRNDLNLIQTVRNTFAHSPRHLQFHDKEIANAVDQIQYLRNFAWGGIFPEPISHTQKFIEAVTHFFVYLHRKPNLQEAPLRYKETETGFLFS